MKKLGEILILTLLIGIFLMPFAVSIQTYDSRFSLETNLQKANADDVWQFFLQLQSVGSYSEPFTSETACNSAYEEINNLVQGEDYTGPNATAYQCKSYSSPKPYDEAAFQGLVAAINGQGNTGIAAMALGSKTPGANDSDNPNFGCSLWEPYTWDTCIISLIFWLIFMPLSILVVFIATILDFFIAYSISSEAYGNDFVQKAWGAVRDIANVFFILALLYVAIKTILSLNVSNNKKLIGAIVIVALFINFSLFVTRVIVDSSNIVAGIFYNQLEQKDENGNVIDPESEEAQKPKSISVSIVKNFNPQMGGFDPNEEPGGYFFTLILVIFLLGMMVIMFVKMIVVFLARVISLWLSMIFSPLAFASYTVPFEIPGFGHKRWWRDLLKTAFLAPIFIFFLYIILLFGDFLSTEINTGITSDDWRKVFLDTFIPFVIIYILIKQAQKISVELSGEVGKGLIEGSKKLVGGAAMGAGAVVGGAALLGSKTVGGLGGRIAKSDWVKRQAFTKDSEGNLKAKKGLGGYWARMALKSGEAVNKGSWDLRQTKVGGAVTKGLGYGLGFATGAGGSRVARNLDTTFKRKGKERREESELYKTNLTDDEVKKRSEDKIENYYDKREQALKDIAKNNVGNTAAQEAAVKAWDAENQKPQYYQSAEELNTARLEAYKDSLGQTKSLMGSLAYTLSPNIITEKNYTKSDSYKREYQEKMRREGKVAAVTQGKTYREEDYSIDSLEIKYDKEIAHQINEERVEKLKIGLGVAAGAAGGGMVAGAAGAIAGTGAGIVGASRPLGSRVADKKLATAIEKELSGIKKVEERIGKMEEILEKQKETFEQAKNLEFRTSTDETRPKEKLFDNGKISKVKILNAEAVAKVQAQKLATRMNSIIKRIADAKDNGTYTGAMKNGLDSEQKDIEAKMMINVIHTNKLKELSSLEENMEKTESSIYNLKGRKSDLKNKGLKRDSDSKK